MYRRTVLIAAIGAGLHGQSNAPDIAGVWKAVQTTSDGNKHESTFTLHLEGDRVRGKISSRRGSVDITDGTLSGRSVEFRVVRRGNGDELVVTFTGTIEADTMKLTMEYRDHVPVPIVAQRER